MRARCFTTSRPAVISSRPCNRTVRFIAAPVSRARVAIVKAQLQVGSKLDDFPDYYRVLKTSDGATVSLAGFKGKKPVVLFFYPKAGTPGCTKEACKFRDEYEKFVKAGVAVFGISNDSPEENAAFSQAQRLPYPLLTDQNGILRKTFGIKSDMLGLLPGRQTYVIDKQGKCVLSFNDQLNAEKHVDEALRVLSIK